LSADVRAKAIAAQSRAREGAEASASPMTPADAEEILAVVDAAMAAHAGFDR
jgi:hypothetical protein